MLFDRRRQLGLSISQASKVLKLKEQVLIAFEEGDFDNMPQSGYAQGMLSSYARYLGLNPREVVDLFQEELYEHVNGTSSHELRRRTRDIQSGRGIQGYEVVNEVDSRPKAYVEYHGLLPTAGGPAGDMGAFATTSGVRPRTSSVPLASSNRDRDRRGSSYSHAEYVYGRPYNASSPDATRQQRGSSSGYRDSVRQRSASTQRRRSNVNDPATRLLREGQNGVDELRQSNSDRASYRSRPSSRLYRRDDVSTRSVREGEYTDDLRYDDGARPYDRASTISGRRQSRNIASVNRPNVKRRRSDNGRLSNGRGRGGRGAQNDKLRMTLVIILALALLLTFILVFSVSSCVNSKTSTQKTTVPVSSTTSSDDSSSTTTDTTVTTTTTGTTTGTTTDTTTSTDSTSTDSTSSDSTATTDQAAEKTEVTVSLADGELSWLEITCDGVSEVASTLTGPWEQTYTVTDSITIRAGDPSVVTVTENGEQVSFESKAAGLGTITIEGTPITTDESSTDSTSSDSSSSTSGSTSSSSSSTSSSSSST